MQGVCPNSLHGEGWATVLPGEGRPDEIAKNSCSAGGGGGCVRGGWGAGNSTERYQTWQLADTEQLGNTE